MGMFGGLLAFGCGFLPTLLFWVSGQSVHPNFIPSLWPDCMLAFLMSLLFGYIFSKKEEGDMSVEYMFGTTVLFSVITTVVMLIVRFNVF